MVVINQYTDGLNIKNCDENLSTMVTSVKQLYGNIPILIGGDFNRKPEKMNLLSKALNLKPAETEPGAFTWMQKSKKKSLIDHFTSTMDLKQVSQNMMNPNVSDHIPITTVVTLKGDKPLQKRNVILRTNLKKGTKFKELKAIVMAEAFPNAPFIEVAKDLGHTKVSKIYQSKIQQIRESQKSII